MPNKMNIHLVLSVVGILLLISLFLVYGFWSAGTYYDDDIAHYLIARFAWRHPELFFNTWGRPAFTILYAPAALLGFGAVKIFSAIIAGATCLGGIYLARLYRVRWYGLAGILIGLQPEFLRQSFSSLTELSFAFVFCIALIAYKKQNWWLMALASGWLPLARYESLPIVLVFALILIQQKKVNLLLFVAGPLLVQNSFWAFKEQSLSFLLFPFDQLLGLRPDPVRYDYGTGDALYYIRQLPAAFGGISLVLFCYGAIREKFGIMHLCVLLTIATLSITYWLMPSAGVAGYIRHLSVMAPAVGVLAAIGLERFFESARTLFPVSWQYHYGVITGVVSFCLVMGLAFSTIRSVQPFHLHDEQQLVLQAANWFKQSPYQDRVVLGSHTRFRYHTGLDGFDQKIYRPITVQNIEQSPKGSIIIWDSHYSNRFKWRTPLKTLEDGRRFHLLQSWTNRHFKLLIYEKME